MGLWGHFTQEAPNEDICRMPLTLTRMSTTQGSYSGPSTEARRCSASKTRRKEGPFLLQGSFKGKKKCFHITQDGKGRFGAENPRINSWKTGAPCEVLTVILSTGDLGPGWIPDPALGLGFLSPSVSYNGSSLCPGGYRGLDACPLRAFQEDRPGFALLLRLLIPPTRPVPMKPFSAL